MSGADDNYSSNNEPVTGSKAQVEISLILENSVAKFWNAR